jgi:hypothetical protein
MLAFLIAGFTVFATVTDVRVFRALATLPDKNAPRGDRGSGSNGTETAFQLSLSVF